jgi:L-asparaginase
MSPEKVLFVQTGGTIDAEPYRDTPKDITPLKFSVIPTALSQSSVITNYELTKFKIADSKKFTEEDLTELAKFIGKCGFNKIVVIHGTDHIPQNARFLEKQLQIYCPHKTVIFTGAMVPISNQIAGYAKSDGYENLDYAYEQAQTLKAGVYIAFAGKIFDPKFTVKNFKQKLFERLDKPIEGDIFPSR